MEVNVTEEGILITPKKLISKDQAWFWTKEWQEKEKEAGEAIKKGEILVRQRRLSLPEDLSLTGF